MGADIPISTKNTIKTTCTLLKDRKLIKKNDIKEYIIYLINIKIDEKEVILIFTTHHIFIYELPTLKKVYEQNIELDYYSFIFVNRIQKIKNNILILMKRDLTISLIIKKDKNLNKYNIYKGKIFDYSLSSINLVELSNNNLVLLTNYSIYLFKSNEEKEIEFKELFNEEIIKQKLPFYTIDYKINIDTNYDYLDIISMNNDIIVYHNTKYIYIYSLYNKQSIFNIEVIIDSSTDDVIKRLSEDIFFFCGKNIIYFISIKLGMIIHQIPLSKYFHIVASNYLNDNNIIFACIRNYFNQINAYKGTIIFGQFCYRITKIKEKEEIEIELKSNFQLQCNGEGNIHIYELEDGKIITCTKNNIYIYSN